MKFNTKEEREQFILCCKNMVHNEVAKANYGKNDDDLFQEGMLGLIHAVDNYDKNTHDNPFISYAVPCIRGKILTYRALRTGPIKPYKTIDENGKVVFNYSKYLYIDELEYLEDERTYDIPDEINFESDVLNKLETDKILSVLTQEEFDIIMLYFMGFTQKEIGIKLGIYRTTLVRKMKTARDKLAKMFGIDLTNPPVKNVAALKPFKPYPSSLKKKSHKKQGI